MAHKNLWVLLESLDQKATKLISIADWTVQTTLPLNDMELISNWEFIVKIKSRKGLEKNTKVKNILGDIEKELDEILWTIELFLNTINDFSAYDTGSTSADILLMYQWTIEKIKDFLVYIKENQENIENWDITILNEVSIWLSDIHSQLDDIYIQENNDRKQIFAEPSQSPEVINQIVESINREINEICDALWKQDLKDFEESEKVKEAIQSIRFSLQIILVTAQTQGIIPKMDELEWKIS